MSKHHEPPWMGRLLLSALLPSRYREDQLGDLREAFAARHARNGRAAARRWYWRQVVLSVAPNLVMRGRALRSRQKPNKQHNSRSGKMETVLQDLRYGIRSLVKHPAFAIVSTVTLALAIGVNTAIFSIVNVIVFADLPMDDPTVVTIFRNTNAQRGIERGSFSLPELIDYREASQSFSGIAAMRGDQWILTGGDEPLRVDGSRITANFLDVWGIGTMVGRGFLEGEDMPGAPPVALLSHGFWSRQFGGRSDMVGSQIRLDGEVYTVVGVMSPEMEFADLAENDVWLPLEMDRSKASRERRSLFVTARLKPGVSGQQAYDEIAAIGARLAEEYPATQQGWEPRALMAMDTLLDADGKTILLMLVLTVAFVLLIACANVANMLLARASARGREMAVRVALGAARVRLVRQLLTESLVIGLTSAVIGVFLSRALMQSLIAISGGREVIFLMAELDGNVLLFTLIVSVVTPLAFGLLPALSASAHDTGSALKEGSARSGGRKGNRTRGVLVGSQVSLALMLMVVAGLLARSVIATQRLELAFDPDNVLSMAIDIANTKYAGEEEQRQFFQQMMAAVEALPAVEGVALATGRPAIDGGRTRAFTIEGQPPVDDADRPNSQFITTSPSYFDLLEIPVVQGRNFSQNDDESSFRVAVVGQEAARRFWPNDDPVGQRIKVGLDESAEWVQIVGIVRDVRSSNGESELPDPQIFLPFDQNPRAAMVVMVRSKGDPSTLAGPVRTQVWTVDPDQPVDDVRTMNQALYDDQSTGYALITLFVAFAIFALCMAGVGIYGVMSYAVSQRASEISIRLALGAKAGDVRMMVLRQGGKLIVLGGATGMVGAVLISRLLSGLVFGISTLDPVTFIGVPTVLMSIGLLANYLPARRATRIDPMRALRVE